MSSVILADIHKEWLQTSRNYKCQIIKVNISIGRFIDTNEHVRVWGESMACQCCMELSQLLIIECVKYGNSFCLGCMIPEDHGCPCIKILEATSQF